MKRKDFIKNSSGIFFSSMIATHLLANTNLSNVINLGVIGTGDRGKGIIKLLNKLDGFNVIAVCDILSFRLNEAYGLIETNKNGKAFKDYRKLLDDKNIDAVVISTPLHSHDQISVDALDADKHVYCEKTLAKGVEATARIVKKSKTSKKIFLTGHQYHSSRMYTK